MCLREVASYTEWQALEQNLRVDGRHLSACRALEVEARVACSLFFSSDIPVCQVLQDGVAQARLGSTRVLATVTAELVSARVQAPHAALTALAGGQASPSAERQSEGLFVLNFELQPSAFADSELGRTSEHAQELGRLLERGLKQSGAWHTRRLT